MIDHRVSRQNVKLFLREPLGAFEGSVPRQLASALDWRSLLRLMRPRSARPKTTGNTLRYYETAYLRFLREACDQG
jgi:hypothetical protein